MQNATIGVYFNVFNLEPSYPVSKLGKLDLVNPLYNLDFQSKLDFVNIDSI